MNYIFNEWQPLQSRSFVPKDKKTVDDMDRDKIVCLMVDAMRIYKKIKNPNLKKFIKMIFQGYDYADIARELVLSKRTIEGYPNKLKKLFEKVT